MKPSYSSNYRTNSHLAQHRDSSYFQSGLFRLLNDHWLFSLYSYRSIICNIAVHVYFIAPRLIDMTLRLQPSSPSAIYNFLHPFFGRHQKWIACSSQKVRGSRSWRPVESCWFMSHPKNLVCWMALKCSTCLFICGVSLNAWFAVACDSRCPQGIIG